MLRKLPTHGNLGSSFFRVQCVPERSTPSQRLREARRFIWHQSENLAQGDCPHRPGGFLYGDYFALGACAFFTVMKVSRNIRQGAGGMVLGI